MLLDARPAHPSRRGDQDAGLIAFALGELLGVTQVYWAVLTTTS
jgi:hypothetical protein